MNKTWVFSDPHYGHKNICRGTTSWEPSLRTRPFDTIEQMNNAIVESINACAEQDDTIICIGDWAFGSIDNIYTFYSRLICKNIIFIPGNHDTKIKENRLLPNTSCQAQDLFIMYPELITINHKGTSITLCHYPLDQWENKNRGGIHIHGHSHHTLDDTILNKEYRRIDVGWTETKGIYLLDDIIEQLSNRKCK